MAVEQNNPGHRIHSWLTLEDLIFFIILSISALMQKIFILKNIHVQGFKKVKPKATKFQHFKFDPV